MKNKKNSYKKHKSVKTVKKNALIWVAGITLVLGTFIYAAYSQYIELPLIAGVRDDYQYNLGQSAAGNISKEVKKYNAGKSTDQIRAEAQLTLREMAKAEPSNKPLQKIAANAEIAVKTKPIKKEAQKAAEEVIKTQNTTITNDVAAIAKTAADRQAAAEKLAAEQAATALAARIAADQAAVMVETQPSLITKKDSCPGGNGVKIPPGSFVATGYGLDDNGQKCTSGGCSKRECVEIKDDCSHGVVRACNVQYSINPSSVILPFDAGTEFTVGMTEAQVKEKQKADPSFKKPEIVKNCYEGNGTIQTTGTLKGNIRCVDGAWQPDNSNKCDQNKPIFNATTNTCEAKPGPTQEQIAEAKRIAEEAAKKEKAEQEKNASRLRNPYSQSGCAEALKPGEKCLQSSDNSLLYMIVSNNLPKDIKVLSGVTPTTISSETIKVPTPSSTFKGEKDCADALASVKTKSSCEPIAGGAYYKIVAEKDLPIPQREYVKYVFGEPLPNTNSDTPVSQINSDGNVDTISCDAVPNCEDDYSMKCVPDVDGGKCVSKNLGDVVDPTEPAKDVGNAFSQIGDFFAAIPGYFTDSAKDVSQVVETTQVEAAKPRPALPSVKSPERSVKNYDKCFVSSDCESGYCAPNLGNIIAYKCNPKSSNSVKVINENGTYKESQPCYDSAQCGAGLFCKKSAWFDTCSPISE